MNLCPACGAEIPDGSVICPECGHRGPEATSALQPVGGQREPQPEPQPELVDMGVDLSQLREETAILLVHEGPGAGSRFLLDADEVMAGRSPDAEIFLDDITVSRRHAVFTREGGSFRVTDQGSLNGTYVNNEPAITELLADGDEVQIGKFRMSLRLPGGEDG